MTAIVVLALTGFSTGRGHGGSSSSGSSDGGGGGGCSSSSQDHDSSSSSSSGSTSGLGKSDDYDDDSYDDDTYDDSYDSGSTGDTRESAEDGTAKLVSCASSASPYATVEVTNPNAYESDFFASVAFVDKKGRTVVEDREKVTVPAKGVAEVKVYVGGAGDLAKVDHCEVEPEALWTSS